MIEELKDEWVPENPTTPGTQEPLVEREWAGSKKCYVHVRLADVERTLEWREVEAETLEAAIKVAEAMPDVEVCLEASITPGGVVT